MMNRTFLALIGILLILSSCTFQTSSALPEYYRVKHDSQLAIYNYESRTADESWAGIGPQTPEIVPLFVAPKLSAGTHRTKVGGEWEILINALNKNDDARLRYLKSRTTALFNSSGFPQLESLTMGGNIIKLVEIQGKWGRVYTLDHGQPPDAEEVNYMTRPDLVHKFVVVGWKQKNEETVWVNPPRGDLYWPLVSSRPVWIPLENLEKFPDLPLVLTANGTVYIQLTPGSDNKPSGSRLSTGQSAKVVEYYPSASSVWGRLSTGGWIALLWYPAKDGESQYPTSWTMETVPPPPPE